MSGHPPPTSTFRAGPGNPQSQSPSPFGRGAPQPQRPAGWASPVPLRMTQSPPPFLIRPMVGARPNSGPFSPPMGTPPPRWSPAPGTPPIPHPFTGHGGQGTPPPPMMTFMSQHHTMSSTTTRTTSTTGGSSAGAAPSPRPFFRPIILSPPSAGGQPPPPFSPELLQPSFDMEFVYPSGMEETQIRRSAAMTIPQESVDEGPSTAQIIAAQSQDYVDERLAEYQATIQHLQDEQERVQKKTFVNWINSYLAKHVPPLHIVDLIEDLKDGTRLLALLQVLSGERLPVERGRNAKRPHFLSNCNTALEFLQRKKIKLVNINSSDVVDGRPAVVLGLVWTIILYFQLRCTDLNVIEENTKVLASLGYRFGAPTPTPTSQLDRSDSASPKTVPAPHGHGRMTPSDRWRDSARKSLLAWVKDITYKRFGVVVNDFGNSWRDGNAFLAIINSIQPGLVDMEGLRNTSNHHRLETAFRVAEQELQITRLLDPEDVDVPRPDEKSIMTYVAQFLHKSNEPRLASDSFSAVQGLHDELQTWLMQKTQFMEHMRQTGGLPLSYPQYEALYSEFQGKQEPYHRLKTLMESHSMVGITPEAWAHLQSLWRKLESQLKEWEWRLDSALPEPFGGIGEWLAKAELLVTSDDVPTVMDDEAARVLNTKIEDHKAFFIKLPEVLSQFTEALNTPLANQVPSGQLQSMASRLHAIGSLATRRAVKLKFLEHKCCLVAFIVLVENRLKQWTVKYGREDHVKTLLEQYNNFVNRNKIFQEFERAYIDMQHVIEELKREGGIDTREGRIADHFLWEIGERWKSVSMELRCLQSMLEEVIAYWRRYDSLAPELEDWIDRSLPMIHLPEEEKMDYFQDVGVWHDKYNLINDTVSFLGATCDPGVVEGLKSHFAILSSKWESLFAHVKQYKYAGQMLRMRRDFLGSLSALQKWLRAAESILADPQPQNLEAAKELQSMLQRVMDEIDDKDEEWRVISKKFQSLLPELAGDEVDRLMKTIKKEKECLVRVRAQVPARQAQIHQLLTQQESLEAGQQEIAEWLSSAEVLMNSLTLTGGPQVVQQLLDKHRQFFAKTLYYKTMLESKSKVVGGIVRSGERGQGVENLVKNMQLLTDHFKRVEQSSQSWEHKLMECIRCWRNYDENKQTVMDWMGTAEKLLQERNLESKQTVEAHKNYFDQINDRPLRHMGQASRDLQQWVSPEELDHINRTVAQLQTKWSKIMAAAPVHLAKLEFRLEEDNLASLLKEMDREITAEHQLLNRKEDSQAVLMRHLTFFDRGKVSNEAKVCLEKLSQMEVRYTVSHPEDTSLKEQLAQARAASNTISERVKNLRVILEEIPVQWNAYKAKYEEVVLWMDSVDVALKTILVECTHVVQFETEKAKFVEICREVDRRREDMKQLVQMLDTLVSRRADEEALKEQDQLESLITRYKNLVPTVEMTMIKTDIYSRCYMYREETSRVISALGNVDNLSGDETQPSSLEEVEARIGQQSQLLRQLEGQRTTIVSLLQKGKDLQKDTHSPAFIPEQVLLLDKAWNDTYSHANDKLAGMKGVHKVWVEYRSQRDDILNLLGQAEFELKKLVPKHDPKLVAIELRAKQDMSIALREATENMLRRLRELAESLGSVAGPEKAGVLVEEVAEIETRLKSMLNLLDDKVKHLGESSQAWGALSDKIEDMRGWMKGAQKALQQLLSSDLSPEDKLRKTKEFQAEIGRRMGMLQALEKQAQDLLQSDLSQQPPPDKASISNKPVETPIFLQHVDTLKDQLINLHDTVATQNAVTTQTMAALKECKAELSQVTPWLEKAEVKVAMGWGKPTRLGDARQLVAQLSEFSTECTAQQGKISDTAKRTASLGPVGFEEMELAQTQWASISNAVGANKEKAEVLLKNWEKLEVSLSNFGDWLSTAEKALQKPLDRKMMTIPQLELSLTELKSLNKEISDHQSKLIGVTQETDAVVQHVSPEGASTLNANVAKLKSRLGALSNEVRGKLNYLSDSIIARQEFDARARDFSQWLNDFGGKQASCDIYYDKLDAAMGSLHSSLQEHGDHLGQFKELEDDSKVYKAELSSPVQAYDDLGQKLVTRKDLISQWIQLAGWVSETNSAIEYCNKQLTSPGIKKSKIHEIEHALDNLGEKTEEWMPKAGTLDSSSRSACLSILDKASSMPLSAQKLILDTKQRLTRAQKAATDLVQQTEKIGGQMEKVKELNNELQRYFADTQNSLDLVKPEKCSLASVQGMKDNLQHLVEKHAGMEGAKAKVAALGQDLIRSNPNLSAEFLPILKSVGDEYDRLQGVMNYSWEGVLDTIALWKKYDDSRDAVLALVGDAEKLAGPVLSQLPTDAASAAGCLEALKRAGDLLSKKKILVENCAALNGQLVSALEPIPLTETGTLSAELGTVKGSYDNLCKSVAAHIPKLEMQLLLWRNIEGTRDELEKWLGDTGDSLQETQAGLGNSELARMRLGQYKDELGDKFNAQVGLTSKAKQLQKLAGKELPALQGLVESLEGKFRGLASLSKDLEKSLGSFEDKEQEIKSDLKGNTESLIKLKEVISKCEDRSGTPSDLITRINVLQKAKMDVEALKPHIESVSVKITSLKESHPSWDNSLALNDLKTQRKRLTICENQSSVVSSALVAVLEKNFLDKYGSLSKIVHGLMEKIKWCDPGSISDNFSLDAKKASLKEVGDGVREAHEKVPPVQDAFSTLQDIPGQDYLPKLAEHGDTLNKILNDLMIVEKNHKHMQSKFDNLAKLWQNFDQDSDQILGWLKDFENIVRSETLTQLHLPELDDKIRENVSLLGQVKSCEDKLKSLTETSQRILQLSPDARTGASSAHLGSRVGAVAKFLNNLKDKLIECKGAKEKFQSLLREANDYVDKANGKMNGVDKSGASHQAKLEQVKEILEAKEGLELLNKVVEAGESLIPGLTTESKESVRGDLRELRDKWEAHLDSGNALVKRLEALQMQWTSFDESVTQLDKWLKDVGAKADKNLDSLQPTLADKKVALQTRRSLLQDISSHADIIASLQGKLAEFPDSGPRLASFSKEYNSLKNRVAASVAQSEGQVGDHEQFDFLSDSFGDWLKRHQAELDTTLGDLSDSASRLATLNQLQAQLPDGAASFSKVEKQLVAILPGTHPSGRDALKAAVSTLKQQFVDLGTKCEASQEQLKQETGKLVKYHQNLDSLLNWVKQKEFQVKDPSFKSTVEAKTAHLAKLEGIQAELLSKEPEFAGLLRDSASLEPELQSGAVELNSRFVSLSQPLQESIGRYKNFIRAHASFNKSHAGFLAWIEGLRANVKDLSDISGDMPALTARRSKLSTLLDERSLKTPEMEKLVDEGEKLYSQTSPDGREVIRQQIRSLRDAWETCGEMIQSSWQKLDACLSQFGDFTTSQEELTKWLEGIEASLVTHGQLKSSLQEKRAVLANHKIINQEIASHQGLVEAVCDKATQLVELSQDSGLQSFISSTRSRFQDTKQQSKDLLNRLESSVSDHVKLNEALGAYIDWRNGQRDKISALEDLTGEKADVLRRLEGLQSLKDDAGRGNGLLEKVEDIAGTVILATSQSGAKSIESEVSAARDGHEKLESDVQSVMTRLQAMLHNWQNFEAGLTNYTKWFREQEAVFRSQVLQNNLPEKAAAFTTFTQQRQVVTGFEKEVTAFLDQSHALLQTSNAERIKPLVMQISNRYQLLHVLSKEVVNKWQGIVGDHTAFDNKFSESSQLLDNFEHNFARLVDEPNLEARAPLLSALALEKEVLSQKINVLVQMGEKLFPDTGAGGREKIRSDLRALRDRFEAVDSEMGQLAKRQSSESQQWGIYQDQLASTLAWLSSMEAAAAAASEPPNWLSIPDTKSKLMRLKTVLQDAISHRRVVEGVIEKAEALLAKKLGPAQPEELKSSIESINTRYETLLNSMLESITGMEEVLDLVTNWNDTSKKEADWQKNLWEQLSLCSDYSGGKPALSSRLARVVELQSGFGEGESLLSSLDAILTSLGQRLPSPSSQTLAKDLTNMKFDMDKLRSGVEEVRHTLQERLTQWGEYEDGFERLLVWLGEAEGTLKAYSHVNTLEEKETQRTKYQNLLKTLKDNEASFDKICMESSELMQATGESRIASNIQQITSRFQSIQMTAKEIQKKCEQAVSDHKSYREKYSSFLDLLSYELTDGLGSLKSLEGSQDQLQGRLASIQQLKGSRSTHLSCLNAVVESGELLYPSTASEGREIIRAELAQLQSTFDGVYDDLSALERDLHNKMTRWSGFEECKTKLQSWLGDLERSMPREIVFHTTLDEKRGQLQQYRSLLHDILSHQQDVLELANMASSLSEGEGAADAAKLAGSLRDKHGALLTKAKDFVEQYEGIVCCHQAYVKAVQEATEWVDGTTATVLMWSDENQERMNLHANLEKLKNLHMSFPEEEYRIQEIRAVASKVIPGTVESGQPNIRSQVDTSQQEWEALQSTLESCIESLVQKLKLWNDFEGQKESCMSWLKETDSKLHAVDLKPTLDSKTEQYNTLLCLQGEIKAKELELDAISDLQRQVVASKTSGVSSSDLATKYTQISHKIKELTGKWQSYVNSHQDFDSQLDSCCQWLGDIKDKLAYCSDLSAFSQKDLETKLGTVHDLLMFKDEGYAKIQNVVELAQGVLANTSTSGHPDINQAVQKVQDEWSMVAAKMVDTKNQLDENIHKWAGFLEQIHQLKKTVDYLQSVLKDVTPFLGTLQEKRSQLDTIRNLEEKMVCERLEVESLKGKASEMMASGQQSLAAGQAQEVLKSFDSVGDQIRKLLIDREAQFRDHKVYSEALEELLGWLSRTKEKIPSFKQRSLGDRLMDVESAGAMLTSLMNKKPQGVLLVERLQQSGEVASASSSPQGKASISSEVKGANESFEALFTEIQSLKDSLESTMRQLRDWKEEQSRLSDWLQQCEILIKAAKTTLMPNLSDKKKQVGDVHEVMERLEVGSAQIQKFNDAAEGLLASHLDNYVGTQLRQLNSRYQVQLNVGKDVLKKVEANLEQHSQFLSNYEKAQNWMEGARQIIGECSVSSSTGSSEARKERLMAALSKIQELVGRQEEGQNLVHNTVSWGEKSLRNTRSDGRDAINEQIKQVQTEWERIVKKMASTKSSLETASLQWADYNTSYSQVSQWISDREAKLQKVAEPKPQRGGRKRHPTPGMSSASIGDRKATLRATNTIVQDIVSLEPMIESVTSKAENLMEESPASEISHKYQNLSKQAQAVYQRQKEIVEQHQAFVDLAAEFMGWMRAAKERLAKISEPVGDKEILSSKITQLKVLQSELPEGQAKLEAALVKGSQACGIVDGEDRELIEEEVAVLQEEFDSFSESLAKSQQLLEIGLVRWKEWEDQHREAEEWLSKTEEQVKVFHKLQNTLTEKKVALEQFQSQLQTIFDWQKDLDKLNLKAQLLLETCADSRVSNAVTQISSKFSALLSLSKEVIRRLECHYQEHQQHSALYQECQDWIDRTREKLTHISDLNYNLSDVISRLQSVKGLKQTLEQGQNKLRYALELKEKVMLATEPSGAAKIDEDTELLKSEFDRLMADIQETRVKLAARASLLEELDKADKLIQDWLQELELKINVSEGNQYVDLSEKRSSLEKLRGIEKEVVAQYDMLQRLENKMGEDPHMPREPYMPTFVRYEYIKSNLIQHIKRLEGIVREHEDYWKCLQGTTDTLRKLRAGLTSAAELPSSVGKAEVIAEKLGDLSRFSEALAAAEICVKKTKEKSVGVGSTTSADGKDVISGEVAGLQFELDSLQALFKDGGKTFRKCLDAWAEFERALENVKLLISGCDVQLRAELGGVDVDKATPEDLERVKKLLGQVSGLKSPLEDLSDRCETLMEFGGSPSVRESTGGLQASYSTLLASVQGLVAKIQKSLSDHTDFLKERQELEAWLDRAEGTLTDCSQVGTELAMRDNLETVKLLSTRLTEGGHLLTLLQDGFARVVGLIPPEQQVAMRNDVTTLQTRWETLNMNVKNSLSDLKAACQRWDDFKENCLKSSGWVDAMQDTLALKPSHKAELGDMKTLLERYKNLGGDILAQQSELDSLEGEADQLVLWSGSESVKQPVLAFREAWTRFDSQVRAAQKLLETEIREFTDYHNALQDTEKWLLQTSFQLMAHNSLYITNREQTLEQLALHDALLEEIQSYQDNLDGVKAKGRGQVEKYLALQPGLQAKIEKQLKNVQDSYDSLLHTGFQIKKRLEESLQKFQEYEDALESIMRNLDEWEPEIEQQLQGPIDNVESSSKRLEYIRATHNRLQGEKSRLSLAVAACEAATATLSRPTSPQEAILQPIPDKELAVRGRLEDLIDKIQTQMAALSSASIELEEVRTCKESISRWVEDSRKKLQEISTRPAKLHPDTATMEMNVLQDIRQGVVDRTLHLAEIEAQESALVQSKYLPQLSADLASLDADVSSVIDSRLDVHAKIHNYRDSLASLTTWLEGIGNKMTPLEKGGGLTLPKKKECASQIWAELEAGSPRVEEVTSMGASILSSLSNVDAQLVEEQIKSVTRRFGEMKKRIERKRQILGSTATSYQDFQTDSEKVKSEIQALVAVGDSKRGFDIGPMEECHQMLKSALKDVEGKQTILDTLDRRLTSLLPELEEGEIISAEASLAAVVQLHSSACDTLRLRLRELAEELGSKRKFLDKLQRAKSWVGKMEGEVEDNQVFPLTSGDVSKRLELLKRHQGAVKDFADGPLAEIKREGETLQKECSPTQQVELVGIISNLETSKDKLHDGMEALVAKLREASRLRADFETTYDKCESWMQEAEAALSSDLKGSGNLSVLEEQRSKYAKLAQEAETMGGVVASVKNKATPLLPTLKEPDRHIIGEKVASLTSRMSGLSASIRDRCAGLDAAIAEFATFSNIIEEAARITKEVRDKLNNLNKPVGSAIEDSQGLLASVEKLLDQLKSYRGKLDALNLPSFKERRGELQSIMKEQDDLISQMESQIQRLRHLLLLQQQYLSLTTEITNFIAKYTEIVGDVERRGGTVEEKVKQYSDIWTRIQECEAQLSSATDKGARIAEEGTVSDRNMITEQLQSIKQSLHNLRRLVETKRADYELALAEHKKAAAELDGAIAALHDKETIIRSRPLLQRPSSSVDKELSRHDELVKEVGDQLQLISGIEEMLRPEEASLPPTLLEKLSETRLLLKTIPNELIERGKYLEANKSTRTQYEEVVAGIETWILDANKRLHLSDGGLNMENIFSDISAHKAFFANEKTILGQVQTMKSFVDKMWPSLLPGEQETLRKDQDELIERVQNTFNSAKNHHSRLEQNAVVWKNYLDLLEIVKCVIARAEGPDEPATTLSALRTNLASMQAVCSALNTQQQELDNFNERAQSVEKEADLPNRQRIRAQVETLNAKWMEAMADLDSRKDSISKLVTQWEKCESLWTAFEGGLSAIEEQFSQIDPSIRSQTQLQDTKEAISAILEKATALGPIHKDLLHHAQFILAHLQHTSDICYSTLKSKLEHLSTQYNTILLLLKEKLDWLNNQDAFLSDIDNRIEALQNRVDKLDADVDAVNPFDPNVSGVAARFEDLSRQVRDVGSSIADFSSKTKEKFSSLKQVFPTSIGKSVSNLEVDVERVGGNLEDKKSALKRASQTRAEFQADLEAVNEWLAGADDRLGERLQEPQLLKEVLQSLSSALPEVVERFERALKNGGVLIDKTTDARERDEVVSGLDSTRTLLDQVKAAIEERRAKIAESMDSWTRFLQLHAQVKSWCEDKKNLMTEALVLNSLGDTRQKLNIYDMASKTLKTVNKQLSEMGKEIDKVAETSSTGPLTEKFEAVEHLKIDIEAQLLERNALLLETTEEWEQCERKLRETQAWLEKARTSLENPAGKRKPLRDQLTARDKILADVAIQRTKITLAVEKLQVHFKAGISGEPNVAGEAADMGSLLNSFETEVKGQCTSLEASVSEIDGLQEELQQLRNDLGSAEQQLRNLCNRSPSAHLSAEDRDRGEGEQKRLGERVKGIQSKITARNERIKLLLLH